MLAASVGPGFDISLTAEDGEPVETLAAGTYTVETDDQSGIHNFHLTGEGVDVDTGVSESGTDSFEITVERGDVRLRLRPARGVDERQLRRVLSCDRGREAVALQGCARPETCDSTFPDCAEWKSASIVRACPSASSRSSRSGASPAMASARFSSSSL